MGEDPSTWLRPCEALKQFEPAWDAYQTWRILRTRLGSGMMQSVAHTSVVRGQGPESGWRIIAPACWSDTWSRDETDLWSADQVCFSNNPNRFASTIALDSSWMGGEEEIEITAFGIRFDPDGLPTAPATSGRSEVVSASPIEPIKKRGRPPSNWWPAFAEELAVYVHDNGIPEGVGADGQGTVIEAILARLAPNADPSRAAIQPVIQAVIDRLRSANK